MIIKYHVPAPKERIRLKNEPFKHLQDLNDHRNLPRISFRTIACYFYSYF